MYFHLNQAKGRRSVVVARCEDWGFYCAKERILQDWECTWFRDTGIRVQCVCLYIKGKGLSCMANDYQPPNPHPLNLNSPLRTYCELYSLWRFWDFIRWILSYFSAPGLEFNFLSLTYVWWIVEHWSSDLPPLPNANQHVQQCQKTMRSKIELKYLTEGFRHILLFDNLWRNAISCDLRLA